MNYEELSENLFTGGCHIFGYVKMDVIHEFDRDHDVKRHLVHGYPTDYMVRDSDVMTMLGGDTDFGYKINHVEAAISILKLMNINKRDVIFHFPDKDAPLILTINCSSSTRIGLEWGILICSCDVEPEESI